MDQPAELPIARPIAFPYFGPLVPVRRGTRCIAALVALGCLAILTIAVLLKPDPRGFGTHEALFGAWPCGFILTTGLPCPTCGMTTSFAELMHGHPIRSFITQPAGAVLCLATIGGLILSLYILLSGRAPVVNWERLGPVRLTLGFGLMLFAGWGFKMAHGLLAGTLPAR